MISDMETLELQLPPPITCCDPCDSPDDSGSEYDLPPPVEVVNMINTRSCSCSAQCIDLFNAVPFKVHQLVEMHSVFGKKTRESQNNMLFEPIKKHYDKDWALTTLKTYCWQCICCPSSWSEAT